MKSKIVFKIGAILCLICFYFVVLIGIFALGEHSLRLWSPDSELARSFGDFQPLFSYIDLNFYQQPELYTDPSFVQLSFISTTCMLLFMLLFLWFMRKLLNNIYEDSLFSYENVSIVFKLGLTIIVTGSAYTYTDGLLLSKALAALTVSNAQISLSNLSYVDTITGGIVLLLISWALKIAVHAVEENSQTI
ncbi:hypothetical protein AV654_29485 [Paenibacillus elgii]|uniref:DUF2975 domain-containing protein n=1 Tax=Paenibacillus elgii TaxID=189691 RepID=A0A163V6S2_9BACL|nr:DUF2975 domain-containing protein [Paenibacillus elgii]KZE74423.1 hypothetical protein AV654_29485 [Paenibacillus elgii]